MVRVIKVLIIVLLIAHLTTGAQAATLHGTIYEWSDFESPLKNAIVEVNSTPAQYMVATAGTYSFNLSAGSYLIRAKYYRNNILELVGEESVQIDKTDVSRDFIHDILLFPPTDSEYEYLGDINLTSEMDDENEINLGYYILIGLILVFSVIIGFYIIKRRKSTPIELIIDKTEAKPENIVETRALPEDLHTLYNIILKSGGRITQRELRKKIAYYSEAKISLMLDDLENRGLITKIRKGRSNVIIAQTQK